MSDITVPAAAPVAAPAPAIPAVPAAEEFFEVVSDGKSEKLSKTEVLRRAALSGGANKRFEEAAAKERKAEALLSRMRDPKAAIQLLHDKSLGLDPAQIQEAFETWYKENVIDRAAMSPEQRELADAKARIKAFEDEKAEHTKKQEAEEGERADSEERAKIQKEILGLLDSSGLPKTKFTASRLAYWTRINEAKGLNAPAELIIEQVRKEARDVMSSMIQSSEGDVLIKLLGDDTVKKLRKYDLAQLRAKRGLANPTPSVEDTVNAANQEKISLREVRRRSREFK